MATTYEKIATVTVGSGGASTMSFTSIPSTYTDLCLKLSGRLTISAYSDGFFIEVNGGTSYPDIELYNSNGSAASYGPRMSTASLFSGHMPAANATASTFGNHELYIANYNSTGIKPLSFDGTTENNGTQIYQTLIAGRIINGAAINSITVSCAPSNFVQYSTATLYGIKNS